MGCGSSQPHSQETINFLKSALKSRKNTAAGTPIIILPSEKADRGKYLIQNSKFSPCIKKPSPTKDK